MTNLNPDPYGAQPHEQPAVDYKKLACQFLTLVAAGNIDAAYRDFVAMDGRHHNPYFPPGFPALLEGMKASHTQFPNMRIRVVNVLADDSLVATHSHIILQPGEAGIVAVHLFRFHDNRIVELWDCSQPVPVDSPNTDGIF